MKSWPFSVQKHLPLLRWPARRRTSLALFDYAVHGVMSLGRLHPQARLERHGVEVIPDLPYRATGLPEHTLDIYRPIVRPGLCPVVLYVHGGAFATMSKDTHWLMALAYARRGYVVLNINYRLAPRHPFPSALEDCCSAYVWLARNAAAYGADPGRLVLAGDSAGANLVTALSICATHQRPEGFARAVFATDVRPLAVVPACGVLQVSSKGRSLKHPGIIGAWVGRKLLKYSSSYLARSARGIDGTGAIERTLADPLLLLERGQPSARPLPAFFVPVGTCDALLDDSRRLKAALDRLEAPCEVRYYSGEIHLFHIFLWRPSAQKCWQEIFDFLDRHLPAAA